MTDALIVNPPVAVAPPLYFVFFILFFLCVFLAFSSIFPQVPSVTHYAEVQLRPTQPLLFAAHGAGFGWCIFG